MNTISSDAMNPEHAPKSLVGPLFESLGKEPGWERVAQLVGYGGGNWLRALLPSLMVRRSILDLGCADGYLGRRLRELGYRGRLVGVDASATLLDRCRLSGLYDECRLCDVDLSWPEFGETGFDLAIAFGLTEFIARHGLFLSKVRAVLGDGSPLWITFEDSVGNPEPFSWMSLHTESSVAHLLREAGFRVTSIDRVDAGRCVHRLPDGSLELGDSYIPYLLAVARNSAGSAVCAGNPSNQSTKP